jgi:hypothetical protein
MATMDFVWTVTMTEKTAPEMVNFFGCPLGQLVDGEKMSRHGGEH